MSNDSNDTYVCFKGEKIEKYDKKNLGPIFGLRDQKIVKSSGGNNSSNSKAWNLKF